MRYDGNDGIQGGNLGMRLENMRLENMRFGRKY